MFRRTQLLSIALSNLAALASAQPGPLNYNLINLCPIAIEVRFNTMGGSSSSEGVIGPHSSTTATRTRNTNSGFFYTEAHGGTAATATKAGFHADSDDDSYYYYVVKDSTNFKTGISITPSHAPDSGFCSVARCDDVSCDFAFSRPPTSPPTFPRPVVGVPPTPPLYSCPFTRLDSTYDITFCPSGDWPLESSPLLIHPNGNTNKCLDVQNVNYANDGAVQILDCDKSPSQQWFINRGTTQVRVANKDFCLDAGSNPASGVPMKIWQCYDNLPAQKWYYSSSNGEDHDRIALVGQGQCLDLTDGHTRNGNRMQTWECTPRNLNQVWTVTSL